LLNTAKDTPYLAQIEKDVIFECNKARWDPVRYGKEVIEPSRKLFDGKKIKMAGKYTRSTIEGVAAVDACLLALDGYSTLKEPYPWMSPSEPLWMAAKYHAEDQSKNGGVGHSGTSKDTPANRIFMFAKRDPWAYSDASEGIAYGPWCNLAEWAIFMLLVDDGISDRRHQKQIYNKTWKQIGVSVKSHPAQSLVCVLVYGVGMIAK
jgi:hypothetical protein